MKTFLEYITEKKIPSSLVLYHGTHEFFDKVDFNRLGRTDSGFLGKGFYITGMKRLANAYSIGAAKNYGGEPTVLKVTVSPKKYLEIEGTGIGAFIDALREVGIEYDGNPANATSELLKKGYDSLIAWYKGELKELVVYNPKIIKKIEKEE